jgi:hypothetical protein
LPESEVRIREGTDADVPSVVELLKASLGEGSIPRTIEFWNWKHSTSPFGPSPFWIAETHAALVGVRVFLRWQWTVNSTKVESVRAVDTATHPDFQGKGIFSKLTLRGVEELTRRGVAFVFNTPNEKSRPGYLKMGWTTVGRTTLWVAPRKLTALVRVGRSRLRRRQEPGTPDEEDRTEPVRSDLLRSGDVTRLLESRERRSSPQYRTALDASYLEWRYANCPGYRYGLTLGESGRVLVVHRTRRRAGAREVAICELVFDERATVREVAAVIRGVLRSSGADYGVVAPPIDARSVLALSLAGFIPAPRLGPVVTVRPLGDITGLPNPASMRSWGMTIGSLELF